MIITSYFNKKAEKRKNMVLIWFEKRITTRCLLNTSWQNDRCVTSTVGVTSQKAFMSCGLIQKKRLTLHIERISNEERKRE